MELINWDPEVVSNTINGFITLQADTSYISSPTWGHVAESLVQKHFGQPVHTVQQGSDPGYDMVINGQMIDIKNQKNAAQYFDFSSCSWVIDCYKPLRAGWYLFTSLDKTTHKCAIIGFLSARELLQRGRHVYAGEQLYLGKGVTANCPCYVVDRTVMHPYNEADFMRALKAQ